MILPEHLGNLSVGATIYCSETKLEDVILLDLWMFTPPETNSSPLKIDPWKRRFLLETTIFRSYVSFREGMKFVQLICFVSWSICLYRIGG